MEAFTESTATALINAPLETIDLTQWLFTLKNSEYQACSKAHIACGSSLNSDGKRMSINVEQVADNLLIQHYVEEISLKNHCRVNSLSDSFSAAGRTKIGVTWELKINRLSESSCEFTNHVVIKLTPEFQESLAKANITDLETVRNGMYQNLKAHNQEETPLFAKDIEKKALNGIWK